MSNSLSIAEANGAMLPLQASKWLDLPLLIDFSEMNDLFEALEPFYLFMTGRVCAGNEGVVEKEQFLNVYRNYIEELKSGLLPDEARYRPYFSTVWSVDAAHLVQIKCPGEKRILRVSRPVIQLQLNKISYSAADEKLRAMVFAKGSIFWGIQFSYPQLFQDNQSREVFPVKETEQFPNTSLFRRLQRWVRENTTPTPFKIGNLRINAPIRIGKACLPWIKNHCQLRQQQIEIIGSD